MLGPKKKDTDVSAFLLNMPPDVIILSQKHDAQENNTSCINKVTRIVVSFLFIVQFFQIHFGSIFCYAHSLLLLYKQETKNTQY